MGCRGSEVQILSPRPLDQRVAGLTEPTQVGFLFCGTASGFPRAGRPLECQASGVGGPLVMITASAALALPFQVQLDIIEIDSCLTPIFCKYHVERIATSVH